MNHDAPAYGLWALVVFNSAIFLMFAFSFFKPQTARDWRTFGAFAAFIVALFVEMYGFPLSIYLMSGWLQTKYPNLDLMSHNSGHLWSTLLGENGDPHFGLLHIASYVFLGFGFYLLSAPGMSFITHSVAIHWPPPAPMRESATRSTWPSSSSCWASCCSGRRYSR